MITLHHLGYSQSERIVWLLEELNLEYKLVKHDRDPKNRLAPQSLKSLPGNALEAAPLIQDGDITLAESGAITEYIIHKYGNGRLALTPEHADYANYVYWFHMANANLMPTMMSSLFMKFTGLPADNPAQGMIEMRRDRLIKHYEDRLSRVPYLAGEEFTAADTMTLYCFSTNRYFFNFSLKRYPGIVAWMQRCGGREAYQRAMKKGDPNMVVALGEELLEKALL